MAGLNHERVVTHGDKGLAEDWNADHEQTGNHDCDQNQFLNQVIENRTDFPAEPVEGQIIYRTDENILYIYDGTDWIEHAKTSDIAILSGTNYWSCPGSGFNSKASVNSYSKPNMTYVNTGAANDSPLVEVHLPHGAVVTAVIVYGSDPTGLWRMRRKVKNNDGTFIQILAFNNINTEETTIFQPTIDNSDYVYSLVVWDLQQNEVIYGARITYTL